MIHTFERQINDYMLTATGHLQARKTGIDFKQLAAYGTAAGSALALMSSAEAAVQYTTGSAVTVIGGSAGATHVNGSNTNYNGFDVDGDGVKDFAIFAWTGSGPGDSSAGLNGTLNWLTPAVSNSLIGPEVKKLASGFTIAPSLTSWQTAPGYNQQMSAGGAFGDWNAVASETGVAGLKFKIGSNTHYGWVKLRYNGPGNITAVEWAYEACPDEAIKAGATSGGASCGTPPVSVPAGNPALYGLTALSLGVLGLGALRRRRQLRVVADKVQH
jgi:hypothetical protein